MCIHESKMMLTAKKIPNPCGGCWNKRERSCSLTKCGNSCRLVLLYSVVVRCRGCVYILGHGVIDSLHPTLINHIQRQIYFLFTGDASLVTFFFFFAEVVIIVRYCTKTLSDLESWAMFTLFLCSLYALRTLPHPYPPLIPAVPSLLSNCSRNHSFICITCRKPTEPKITLILL